MYNTETMKFRIFGLIIILLAVLLGNTIYTEHQKGTDFSYGLDLSGGSHLVYKADVSNVPSGEIDNTLDILRRTIEKRVNIFHINACRNIRSKMGGV